LTCRPAYNAHPECDPLSLHDALPISRTPGMMSSSTCAHGRSTDVPPVAGGPRGRPVVLACGAPLDGRPDPERAAQRRLRGRAPRRLADPGGRGGDPARGEPRPAPRGGAAPGPGGPAGGDAGT